MRSLNNKISLRQLQVLIILDIFGTGVLILPRKVSVLANQDGWILILISTLFALFSVFLITTIAKMFPNDSFFSYSQKALGKIFAVVVSILFIIKILVSGALELRLFGEILKSTLLQHTPFYIISFFIILVSAYAAGKGYETRGRIAEILIFIVFLPVLFVFGIATTDTDFTNLMPVLTTPYTSLIFGGFFSTVAFSALPFALLALPYLNTKQKIFKHLSISIILIGIFMVFVCAVTVAKFGVIETKRQMWPIIEAMDVVDIPGSFVERQMALVMSIWIVSVFAIINASLFFSSVLLRDVFKKGTHVTYIFISSIIIFSIAFIPDNILNVFELMDFMFITFGILFLFIIPLLIILIGKLRGY